VSASQSSGPTSWLAPGSLFGLLLLFSMAPDEMRAAMRLEPERLAAEPWRLLTAHFVHSTTAHAALNGAALMLFSALLPSLRVARRLAVAVLVSTLGVNVGVVGFHDLDWYVGFSGVGYGIAALGVAVEWGRPNSVAGIVFAGLAVKLTYDAVFGTPALTEHLVGGAVLAEAHVYGLVAGLVGGAVLRRPITRAAAGG